LTYRQIQASSFKLQASILNPQASNLKYQFSSLNVQTSILKPQLQTSGVTSIPHHPFVVTNHLTYHQLTYRSIQASSFKQTSNSLGTSNLKHQASKPKLET
jgi:hypothetical protein